MEYKKLINDEREIYFDNIKINPSTIHEKLTMDENNMLDTVIDSFEDGENPVKIIEGVNYEYYKYNKFEIRRKCQV